MRIFVLEDEAMRTEYFINTFKDVADYCICDNVEDAVEALAMDRYDIIFLDFDLVKITKVNKSGIAIEWEHQEGIEFAKKIQGSMSEDADIVIHSWSEPGAKLMKKELSWSNKVKCEPFGTAGFIGWVTKLVK